MLTEPGLDARHRRKKGGKTARRQANVAVGGERMDRGSRTTAAMEWRSRGDMPATAANDATGNQEGDRLLRWIEVRVRVAVWRLPSIPGLA